jgi:NitT/TauT family transport system permease protein
MKRVGLAALFFAALFVGWELLYRSGFWSPVLLPSPLVVGRYLWEATVDGSLLSATLVTVKRLFLGYVFGLLLGLLFARR